MNSLSLALLTLGVTALCLAVILAPVAYFLGRF